MKEKSIVYVLLLLGGISIVVITLMQMGNLLAFYTSNIIRIGIVFAMQLFLGIMYTRRKKLEAVIFYIFALIMAVLFLLSL